MITYGELIEEWGADGIIAIPIDHLAPLFAFDTTSLPPAGAIPLEMSVVFTAFLKGEVDLFDVVEMQVGDARPVNIVVIGAVPEDDDLLFGLDIMSGQVLLVDLSQGSAETVNSTTRDFVEFLYRLSRFIDDDQGSAARAVPAVRLRRELTSLDPAAFEDPESWWSVAFAQLEGRI